MKKTAIALALIMISIVSVLTASFAYLVLGNPNAQESFSSAATSATLAPSPSSVTPDQENSSLSASASTSSTPVPTTTPAPTSLCDPSYPEGLEGWLPLGTFGIISPANQTYTTNSIALSVGGVIIAGNPYLSYSLDGGPRTPIKIELEKVTIENVTLMQRSISGSVALPQLANGSHVIVLYADLGVESRKGKETIYFEIEAG